MTEKDELVQAKDKKLAEAQQTLQSIEADFQKQRDSAERLDVVPSFPSAKRLKLQVHCTCMVNAIPPKKWSIQIQEDTCDK